MKSRNGIRGAVYMLGVTCVLILSSGCGGMTAPESGAENDGEARGNFSGEEAETQNLQQENERLQAEVEDLERRIEEMRSEQTSVEEAAASSESSGEDGGSLSVAEEG